MNRPRITSWLAERLGIATITTHLREKQVPIHRHTGWYYAGSAILLFFTVQLVTGFLLVLYYRPTLEEANASVGRITSELPFGWVIRSLHHYSATFMIAALVVHLFSTWLTKSYRKPRELTWMTGGLLLGVTLTFGFTGYLLPWDELSLAATKVGTDIPASLPVFGKWITWVLRGGEEVTADTLTRFYGLHVCILPLFIFLLLGVHIALIQKEGMSLPLSDEQRGTRVKSLPFWPNFVYREASVALVLFGVLLTVALIAPPSVGERADLLAPAPEGIRPEWYFLFLFQTLKLFPGDLLGIGGDSIAVALMLLGGLLFWILPFLDRRPEGRSGKICTAAGWLVLLYAIVMTIWSLQ